MKDLDYKDIETLQYVLNDYIFENASQSKKLLALKDKLIKMRANMESNKTKGRVISL